MTSADNSSMNQVLRGRGRPVPTGQPIADADPLAQAREVAAGLASQLDTLTKLLAKAEAGGTNPFAKGS